MRKAVAVLGVGLSGTLLGVLGGYVRDIYSSARFVHDLEKAYGRPKGSAPTMSSALWRVLASDWRDLHYPKWAFTVLPRRVVWGARGRFRRCSGPPGKVRTLDRLKQVVGLPGPTRWI